MITNPTMSLAISNLTSMVPFRANITTTPSTSDSVTPAAFTFLTKIVCGLVLVFGLLGNSLVLMVFGIRWSKLKTCEIFMISLALADLIGTLVVPGKIILELMDQSFHPIRDGGCQLISFLSITSLTVSALTLLTIAVDRFIIVKWPMHERPRRWKIYLMVFLTWLTGSGVGIVYFFPNKIKLYERIPEVYMCGNIMPLDEYVTHTLITFSVQIAIPLIVITVVYFLIVLELRNGLKNALFETHTREMKIRLKRNRKATKLLVVIVIVFFICVLPLSAFFLLYLFDHHGLPIHITLNVFAFLQMLQMVNSCVNPIIYSKLHRSFRRTTLRLLCSCFFTKFQRYDWDSQRGSLLTSTILKSIRHKRKKSSSVSVYSTATARQSIGTPTSYTEDIPVTSKSCVGDDMNQSRKIIGRKHISNVFNFGRNSLGNVSIGTYASDLGDALHSPIFREKLKLEEDDPFNSTVINLKAITKSNTKSNNTRNDEERENFAVFPSEKTKSLFSENRGDYYSIKQHYEDIPLNGEEHYEDIPLNGGEQMEEIF